MIIGFMISRNISEIFHAILKKLFYFKSSGMKHLSYLTTKVKTPELHNRSIKLNLLLVMIFFHDTLPYFSVLLTTIIFIQLNPNNNDSEN